MNKFNPLYAVILFFIFSNFTEKPARFDGPKKILFVGNSFIYFNAGLPYQLKQLAAHDPSFPSLKIEESARAGFALEKHWSNPETIKKIKSDDWDVIILQDHSRRPVIKKQSTLRYAQKFDSLIRASGDAKVYFFMTWASQDDPDMIDRVSKTYEEAARITQRAVVPVGLEWEKFLKSKSDINLYNPDGKHPNIYGTFFTACIFYKILFDKNPALNSYIYPGISKEHAKVLKEWSNQSKLMEY